MSDSIHKKKRGEVGGRHERHHGEPSPELESWHLHQHQCDFDVGHPHLEEGTEGYPLSYRHVERKKLLLASLLTGGMMVVEVVGGLLTNSLALISDAGHMLTHLLALVLSLVALIFASRPPTEKKTFGFYRLEILAALINGMTLLLITSWIFYEVYQRFLKPTPVASLQMLVIAALGLLVNLITAIILIGPSTRSLNTRSALFHLLGDAISSVGVVLGAIAIYFTGQWIIDPLLSIAICILILVWSYRLIMESVEILLEATPRDIDFDQVMMAIKVMEDVEEVHDLHIWTLTSGMYALSAHIKIRNMSISNTVPLLKKLNFLLCQRFRIGHTAIQFECQNGTEGSSVGAMDRVIATGKGGS
ncbi:MAG: cation diffusion facilitator family transporter [Nitrospira sp.]|nr:cation diffusion facilitator family transporter [Nitrospira sp.]